MSKPWLQPTLDHGAVSAATVHIEYFYPTGWEGKCLIRQEGSGSMRYIEVSRLKEGSTDDLETWLRLVTRFIGGY